ncbi:MAG: cytochrome c3 family protein, partial [Myxococcota bacterium]
MPRTRNGWRALAAVFSPDWIAGALLIVLVFAFAGSARAQLIAPGKLSTPHAELDGVGKCFECHKQGEPETSNAKCLSCHTEIDRRIKKGRGYHGRLPPQQLACGQCHREHLGRAAKIIKWPGGT